VWRKPDGVDVGCPNGSNWIVATPLPAGTKTVVERV
jgi:hypothetical protein